MCHSSDRRQGTHGVVVPVVGSPCPDPFFHTSIYYIFTSAAAGVDQTLGCKPGSAPSFLAFPSSCPVDPHTPIYSPVTQNLYSVTVFPCNLFLRSVGVLFPEISCFFPSVLGNAAEGSSTLPFRPQTHECLPFFHMPTSILSPHLVPLYCRNSVIMSLQTVVTSRQDP